MALCGCPRAVLCAASPRRSVLGTSPTVRSRAAGPVASLDKDVCVGLLVPLPLLTRALPCFVCAGTGGRRRWRHPAGRVLRGQGVLAALRRGFCGGIRGLGRSGARHGRDWWRRSAGWLLPTPFPSAPARCPGHHHCSVLLFPLFHVMLPHPPCPVLHDSLEPAKGRGEGDGRPWKGAAADTGQLGA